LQVVEVVVVAGTVEKDAKAYLVPILRLAAALALALAEDLANALTAEDNIILLFAASWYS